VSNVVSYFQKRALITTPEHQLLRKISENRRMKCQDSTYHIIGKFFTHCLDTKIQKAAMTGNITRMRAGKIVARTPSGGEEIGKITLSSILKIIDGWHWLGNVAI
jgi:hypothetical protein